MAAVKEAFVPPTLVEKKFVAVALVRSAVVMVELALLKFWMVEEPEA